MKKSFLERLGQERLYWDGGTGSVLQSKGLKGGELPERWNLTRPEDIVQLAVSYLEAGSAIVNSNTFGANRLHYPDPEELKAVVQAGVRHVQEARRRTGREDSFVALDIGPTGRLLKPMGDLDFEEAVSIFAEVVRFGTEAGADLILIETMNDSMEAKAAVLAAKENSDLPVCVTTIYDGKGKLLTGGTVQSVTAMMEGLRVDALGVNCGLGPRQMLPIVKELTEVCSLPIIVNPNAGLPRSENGKTVYDLSAEEFASAMLDIAKLPVHVLGGCCGTTPEYIRKEVMLTRDIPFTPPVKKHRSVVSSFSRTVEIGGKPVIIGERINPTGKKKFKEALRNKDIEYILQQGIEQEDSGADMLDVNVGLPEIDEPGMMETVVTRLQGVLALPLQIDTTNAEALERGLRIYNGKAMINSVNGKQESMDVVFPLAAKYGGVVVALVLDENGIPDSAEGRLSIARKIYAEAEKYGIPREDILVDGLAMTISTDTQSALTTLETIRRVREELGGNTILGVSNISFGLPQREVINSFFFTMAMQNGLACAIVNPNNEAMMASYRSYLALSGQDPQCAGFIGAYGGKTGGFGFGEKKSGAGPASGPGGSTQASGASDLSDAVLHGMGERSAEETAKLLSLGMDPLEIVNKELIPALDIVGKGFEKGSIFLPHLLMSAEAAKAAFEVVKEAMSGTEGASKGRMILATVKGDIHDIGKNIVKVLLENYGYEVLDLGKDVAPETIVETAEKENISLIGLSALMTTTVVSMEETIRLLRTRKPDTKVVVGGAVMTQEYADQIGADCYAKEAMDTVRYADRIFGA
ncbi:MAG: homocysteine S-methyltransferase family protein [Stomatobaculum sp.]|nr:homocysteine S-methyltransferase family protein [Stomatobaculum sp.]